MRLLHGLAIAGAMAIALPATSLPAAADPWKNESGHGRPHHGHPGHYHGGGGKQVFHDGPCRVERKWKGHGGYREEVKCPAYAYGPGYYYPPVAYGYPAYGYPAYGYPVSRGPSISITIPLD